MTVISILAVYDPIQHQVKREKPNMCVITKRLIIVHRMSTYTAHETYAWLVNTVAWSKDMSLFVVDSPVLRHQGVNVYDLETNV